MDGLDLRGGAEVAWELVSAANGFIVETAPWALAKADRQAELDAVLGALGRCLYRLAVMASPFMPGKAQDLWAALGQPGEAAAGGWDALSDPPVAGARTVKPEGMFPKPVSP
jgi:methionyl-tRNA synthetase